MPISFEPCQFSQVSSRPGVSNSPPAGQMRQVLAMPTPILAKGEKVVLCHVAKMCHEFDTHALDWFYGILKHAASSCFLRPHLWILCRFNAIQPDQDTLGNAQAGPWNRTRGLRGLGSGVEWFTWIHPRGISGDTGFKVGALRPVLRK